MSIDELRQVFKYDPIAGKIYWAVPAHNKLPGDEAGYTVKDCGRMTGRVSIRYLGVAYARSRLMFALVHGHWPTGVIDHIDRDPNNDAISNLRDVSNRENLQNRNRSPNHGIYWNTDKSCYCIELRLAGKRITRTGFASIEAAKPVRDTLLCQY